MKFRDVARSGNTAGIPSNLRAIQPKTRNTTTSYWDLDARKALILRYLRDHQGRRTPIKLLSQVAGFAAPAGASKVMKELVAEGKVVRRKLKTGFTFDVVGLEPQPELPKGDNRNGEVIVRKPARQLQETDAYRKLAAAIAADNPAREATPQLDTPKTPSVTAEALFADELDRQIWEFLKQYDVSRAQYQNTTLGEATQALRSFSQWIELKVAPGTKETTHGPAQEEAHVRRPEAPSSDN